MDNFFRPADTRELKLLEKLLEHDFPGREELLQQLESVTVKTIDEDGSLALQCSQSPPASVKCRVPTEGECTDTDGVVIHVLLHVVNGTMDELEIFKEDSSPLCNPPAADDLLLFARCGDPVLDWTVGNGPLRKPGEN